MRCRLNEKQVKVILKEEGKKWSDFKKFMKGQTIMIDDNGEDLFFNYDLENFFKKNKYRFFD